MPASQDCGAPKGISGPPFTTFTLPPSRGVRIITKVFVTPAITFADLLLSASQAVRWWGANRPRRAKREKNERKEVIIHPLLLSTTSPPLLLPLLLQPSACSCSCPPSDHCLPHIPSPRLVGRSPSFATRPLAVSTSRGGGLRGGSAPHSVLATQERLSPSR